MSPAQICATALAATWLASAASATPFCSDLLSEDTVPSSYKRIAPLHSSQEHGWIFLKDHLREEYNMKSSAQRLIGQIAQEFANRNQRFGILIAPPRPVIAGRAVVDAALDGADFDLNAAETSFDQLIQELNETGAVVPNLSQAARATADLAEGYYFKRDTHWTPLGAAVSAYAFADAANTAWPGVFETGTRLVQPGPDTEIYSEKGSLSTVIEDTCGTRPDPELVPFIAFQGGLERGLLDDLPAGTPQVALLGTSFSDRYQTDTYRVAEALENALGAAVDNRSLTGGGMTGSLETFILNGGLDEEAYDLVIWEVPYTQSFNSTSNLYQLLGALHFQSGAATGGTEIPVGNVDSTDIELAGANPTGVTFSGVAADIRRITLIVRYDDGKTETIKLQRSNRIPAELRSDDWSVRFSPTGDRVIAELSADFTPASAGDSAVAILWDQ